MRPSLSRDLSRRIDDRRRRTLFKTLLTINTAPKDTLCAPSPSSGSCSPASVSPK